MTGINPWQSNILDFPDHRYSKYRQTAEKYRIIQLGICAWKKISANAPNNYENTGSVHSSPSHHNSPHSQDYHIQKMSSYIARPYNIYIFPEDNSGQQQINCETGAIIFNRDHKMDFNKWIYKGIPYLNAKQESSMRESLMDGNLNFYNPQDKNKFKNVILNKDDVLGWMKDIGYRFGADISEESNNGILIEFDTSVADQIEYSLDRHCIRYSEE